MNFFFLFSLLILITALLSYVNTNFLKFPKAIGLTILSIALSVTLIIMFEDGDYVVTIIRGFNFKETLLDGMISFMLFASSLHFNTIDLKKQTKAVLALSVIGVIISTIVTAILMHLLLIILNINVSFGYCLIFGALISPTDPVAVISILSKNKTLSNDIKTRIIGESLFNDATSIVLFVVLVSIVIYDPTKNLDSNLIKDIPYIILIAKQIVFEALGGILLGAIFAAIALLFIRTNKDYETTIFITLAISSMGYIIATKLGVSAPIAMVVSGLIIGKKLAEWKNKLAVRVNDIGRFWHLIENMLNTFLFILLGLELTIIDFTMNSVIVGVLALIVINLSRFISTFIPIVIVDRNISKEALKNKILVTWAGIRGGISLALALSISNQQILDSLSLQSLHGMIAVTYIAVVLSILVQGSTLKPLLDYLYPAKEK